MSMDIKTPPRQEDISTAEKYRDKENAAAIIIQKDWRMFKVKWKYDDKKRTKSATCSKANSKNLKSSFA